MSLRIQLSSSLFYLLLLCTTPGIADEGAQYQGGVVSNPAVLTVPVTFKVVFSEPTDLHDMCTGTEISGRLKEDLKVNKKVIAAAGSIVTGYVQKIDKNGKVIGSLDEKKQRHSVCRLVFDEIILGNHERLKVQALPIETMSIFNNKGEFRSISVGPGGVIKKIESLDVLETAFDIVISRSMVERGMCFKASDEIELRNSYIGSELNATADKAGNETISAKAEMAQKKSIASKKQTTL